MQIESILAIAGITAAGAIFFINQRKKSTSNEDSFPDLPGVPLLGNLLDILGPDMKKKVHAARSPAYLRLPGLPPTLVFDDPALIKQVLGKTSPSYFILGDKQFRFPHGIFSAVGAEHKRLRTLGMRALSKSVLVASFDEIKTRAGEALERLATKTGLVDPSETLRSYAYQTICVIMGGGNSVQFGRLLDTYPYAAAIGVGLRARFWPRFLDFGENIEKGETALDLLIAETCRIAVERRAAMEAGEQFSDALSALIDARDSEDSSLSDNIVFVFHVDFSWLGHQLTSAFYFLAYKITEGDLARLRAEVSAPSALESEASISSLPLLDAFVKETQRMLPVLPQTNRVLTEDIILNGKRVPAGTTIGPLRDLGFLVTENPDDFRLDHFLGDNAFDSVNTNFLPFGMGERMCLGMNLAKLEMRIMIATLLRSYEILKGPGVPSFVYYPAKTVSSLVQLKPLIKAKED
ncbi:Thromboxane-A synthase [Physocladia obscura]|uniref:Thromboxane-A synthase n=1 Tax=Physocladia obscura TaxID=109957 RepID=A0AAD5SZJ5_9FUNG|nr:Thromboxane-A synthase [Physocladia obscura]